MFQVATVTSMRMERLHNHRALRQANREMIDIHGYRANVGIVLTNKDRQVFWAKRSGMDAWQFPQGGIRPNERIEAAMFRELEEETGLRREHVEVISHTNGWLHYRLPKRFIRRRSRPLCIGQKQRWFLPKRSR